MSTIIIAVITAAAAIFASTGFWAFVTKKQERDSAEQKLLMGLAHDRLINLSTKYIHRGFISHEEYEDLLVYLYEPYIAKGGDGTVEKMMEQVKKLEVRAVSDMHELIRQKEVLYGLSAKHEGGDNSHG